MEYPQVPARMSPTLMSFVMVLGVVCVVVLVGWSFTRGELPRAKEGSCFHICKHFSENFLRNFFSISLDILRSGFPASFHMEKHTNHPGRGTFSGVEHFHPG